ncbi:microsomal triglyceride transfer protein-like isoform X2 [Oppia nitens]|uniref:microsomal triglyceride transfer protein-like isoform X2 n=1 Tax=Oppia nitens TaxID=1686743 RepID=UPI0023D9A29C|nr:microsomal triglyceride transfer protein-like isoform X2 [Oppia nitens]
MKMNLLIHNNKLLIFLITFFTIFYGLLCHGPLPGVQYKYSYKSEIIMNNNDYREPTGFGIDSQIIVENIWQDSSGYLLSLAIDWMQFKSRTGSKFADGNRIDDWNHPLFAHIDSKGDVKQVVVHQSETTTASNIKKSLLNHLRSKTPEKSSFEWITDGLTISKKSSTTNSDIKSLLNPEVEDVWHVSAQLASDHPVVISANGWQNVTLQSRIYSFAHSKLYNSFSLKLLSETKSSTQKMSQISISEAIDSLGEQYIVSQIVMTPERETCHNCQSISHLLKDTENEIKGETIASIPMTISYLKLVDRVRSGGPGASKDDIIKLLKSYKKKKDIFASIIDILAGSRTEQSLSAAFEYLNLPKSEDLDYGERFLVQLAVSVMTAAQMQAIPSSTVMADEVIGEILKQTEIKKWKNEKLKQTAFLILATLLRAHVFDIKTDVTKNNELITKVIKHLVTELDLCKETDCRVVLLHAIGNTGVIRDGVYQSIKKYSIGGKRESIAAMKALRECLQLSQIDDKLKSRLRLLLVRVVYDQNQETTSRFIAAELISKYLYDEKTTKELIKYLPAFGNNELATIIWNRAISLAPTISSAHNNWHLHSTTLNGSSATFSRIMGGTKSINASYKVLMELLNKGKLLKESAFDVELSTPDGNAQHLITVGMFARGLQSFAGDSDGSEVVEDNDVGDEEQTMAGMSLRILDIQLRPFTFFTGTGELMGHVWSGTASDPTNAFQGNLLLADYWSSQPLINGFMVDQKLRGILSLDLSGEIQISLWNRNSHSVVHTKGSLLFQGSQTILTSDVKTSASKQFSFGGNTQLDFITDLDFYSTPFKMCMQIVRPEFTFRHNTRKYERVNSDSLHRRIHRRMINIPAKSYAMHRDNNEMCALMNSDD